MQMKKKMKKLAWYLGMLLHHTGERERLHEIRLSIAKMERPHLSSFPRLLLLLERCFTPESTNTMGLTNKAICE